MPKVYSMRKGAVKPPADAVRIDRKTKWGNPFEIGKHGTREEVIALYEYFFLVLHLDLELNLEELRGKDLVCWCAPLPCHGDVLIRLANQ